MSLERVQLSVARANLRVSRRACHNTDVLRKIGWPTLVWHRRRPRLPLLWDLVHGSGPSNLRDQDWYPLHQPALSTVSETLCLLLLLTAVMSNVKSFLPSTVTLFNFLQSSAVSCSSKSSFTHVHAVDLHFVEDKFSLGLL